MSYMSKQDHQREDCHCLFVVFLRPATGYVCRREKAVFTFLSAKIQPVVKEQEEIVILFIYVLRF